MIKDENFQHLPLQTPILPKEQESEGQWTPSHSVPRQPAAKKAQKTCHHTKQDKTVKKYQPAQAVAEVAENPRNNIRHSGAKLLESMETPISKRVLYQVSH